MAQTAKPVHRLSTLQSAYVLRRVVKDIEKFPALFPIVQKGLAVVENAGGTAGELERILQADPMMVARVLRLANSAYFGVMREVRTVSMAVNIIGYRKLRALLRHVLVAGLIELLSQGRPGTARIRQTAVAASAASHELASRCRLEDPEELLVAGLLFNIGEMALFWSFPNEYESMLARAGDTPLNAAQRAVFGVDSRQVGRRVLEAWQFPAVFCQVAERWPDPLSEPSETGLRLYLAIVHVAVVLAGALAPDTQPPPEIPPEILAELKLPEDAARQVLAALPEKIAAVRAILEDKHCKS
jgi:HD-like signal output (HDOD) protein